MGKQKISYPDNGSRAQRVLEAVTPMTEVTAPAINAEYIGQIYVDTATKAVYISVAKGSVAPADDWEPADANAVVAALSPKTGVVAPAAHANFVGQLYVDTAAKKAYIAVATASAAPADDWEEITFAA